jgi:hypothetical protein
MKKTLVVARYKEDTSWAKVESWNTYIVQKGEHLPNYGRESLSYLWYIIKHYEELEGLYCFAQGRISDQIPQLPKELERIQSIQDIQFIYTSTFEDYGDGRPKHPGLDVRGFHKEILPNDEQPKTYHTHSAACFVITADKIKSYNKDFYYKLFSMHFFYHDAAWVMERLWGYIFK